MKKSALSEQLTRLRANFALERTLSGGGNEAARSPTFCASRARQKEANV